MRLQFSHLASFTPVMCSIFLASPVLADALSPQEFAQKASIVSQFEISAGQLAMEKTQDDSIKKLAQQLVADHTLSTNALKAALLSSTVNPNAITPDLDKAYQGNLDNLRKVSPEKFDDEFLDVQEDAHENTISIFEDYAQNGSDTTLKNFASNQLPKLKSHLQTIQDLDDKRD
jgi:putative membrane protein